MSTTITQSLAADLLYWHSKYNGTDAKGTGTALTVDYVLWRNLGKSSVNTVKLGDEDALGAVTAQNALIENSDGYDVNGAKIQFFPENQGEAAYRLDAAATYPGTTIPSGVNSGQLMLDVALREIDFPFTYVNKSWGSNAMTDTSVAAGQHQLHTAGSSDPNYGGLPCILGGYTNPQHTCAFWLGQAVPALYRFVTSSAYQPNAAPTNLAGYSTYGSYMQQMAQKVYNLLLWLDFGGTTNYYAAGPVSNGSGGYTPSAFKISNDNGEILYSHRRFSLAATHFAAYQFCTLMGIQNCGWMEYFGEQSINQAAGMMQTTYPTINTTGGPLLGLKNYFPEHPDHDGMGFEMSYGGASLSYANTAFAYCNNRTVADGVIMPMLQAAYPTYKSRVDSVGNVNLYLDTRCNPYVENNPNSPYYKMNTGQPCILTGGTQNDVANPAATDPYTFAYVDESNVAHDVGTLKSFAWQTFAGAFLQFGSYQDSLYGGDTNAYKLVGSNVYGLRGVVYIAPTNAASTLATPYAAALTSADLTSTVWKNNTYLLATSAVAASGSCGVNQAYAAGTANSGDIEEQKGAAMVASAAIARKSTSVFSYAAPAVAYAFSKQDSAGSWYMGQLVAPLSIAHQMAVFLEPMGQSLVLAQTTGFDPISGVITAAAPGTYLAQYKDKWLLAVRWWMQNCYTPYLASASSYGIYGHRRGMIAAILSMYAYLAANESNFMPQLQTFVAGGDATRVLASSAPFAGLIYNSLPYDTLQIAAAPVNGAPVPGLAYAAGSNVPSGALSGATPFDVTGAVPEKGGWDSNYGLVGCLYSCETAYLLPLSYPNRVAVVAQIISTELASARVTLSRQSPTTGLIDNTAATRDGVEGTVGSGGTVPKTQDYYAAVTGLSLLYDLTAAPDVQYGEELSAFYKTWITTLPTALTTTGTGTTPTTPTTPTGGQNPPGSGNMNSSTTAYTPPPPAPHHEMSNTTCDDSYFCTVGDQGVNFADFLIDLEGNTINVADVQTCTLTVAPFQGATIGVLGALTASLLDDGRFAHTWAAGELSQPGFYTDVRWSVVLAGGGLLTCKGQAYNRIIVQAAA